MKLLVTGAGGMLGTDVARAAKRGGHEPILMSRADLDITDRQSVQRVVGECAAQAVVNCAAWTDVDGAESHPEAARAVNTSGAGNLADAAALAGIPLVHVSTDYVFDGEPPLDDGGPRPYLESDPIGPRSVYGHTKLEGERLVLAACPRHVVVRSSWLFGVAGGNFVATMLRLAGQGESVQVVEDQVGCPTWTGHLAPALIGLLERDVHGLVHLAGTGYVSWNGFAKEIFRQAELDCQVQSATTAQMGRPAPRPAWSAMESERDEVIPMPDWRDGLAGYLAALSGIAR